VGCAVILAGDEPHLSSPCLLILLKAPEHLIDSRGKQFVACGEELLECVDMLKSRIHRDELLLQPLRRDLRQILMRLLLADLPTSSPMVSTFSFVSRLLLSAGCRILL
jgi:hypothetical protein